MDGSVARHGAPTLSRRELLRSGTALGASLALVPFDVGAGTAEAAVIPCAGRLSDIEHVIIMIQENRSFDHYFGSLRGVRGFGDRDARRGPVLPFHLDTQRLDAACTHDVNHDWAPQHHSWNNGAMDNFVSARTGVDGPDAPLTMGYYDRSDLAYYYALAEAFTVCDTYFCSAMSPTDPNRLYAVSGTIDPAGRGGGPIVGSAGTPGTPPMLEWTTMPEQLDSRGISWKVYASPDSTNVDGDNTLLFFKQYHRDPALAAKALQPTFPVDFEADVAAGALPQVSWLIAPITQLEHPAQSAPQQGEYAVSRVLGALTAQPKLWARTALFVTWDENGGFFDHVAPPTPPPGTPGEFLTVANLPPAAGGVRGPIGLGFRVPLLVVSPFSRGGFVCSDVFDHTSLLRFLETRFGAEVPNLSAWRRATAGDLTSAFNFAAPDPSVPGLPRTTLNDPVVVRACAHPLTAYPVAQSMPAQEPGRARRPSGCVAAGAAAPPKRHRGSRSPVPVVAGAGAAALAAAAGLVLAARRRAPRDEPARPDAGGAPPSG